MFFVSLEPKKRRKRKVVVEICRFNEHLRLCVFVVQNAMLGDYVVFLLCANEYIIYKYEFLVHSKVSKKSK